MFDGPPGELAPSPPHFHNNSVWKSEELDAARRRSHSLLLGRPRNSVGTPQTPGERGSYEARGRVASSTGGDASGAEGDND